MIQKYVRGWIHPFFMSVLPCAKEISAFINVKTRILSPIQRFNNGRIINFVGRINHQANFLWLDLPACMVTSFRTIQLF